MATAKLPTGVSCEKLIQSIKDIVHELRNEFQDSGLPINDDNKIFHSFCEKFEYFLKYGQRERSGLLGGRKDYWDYMCKCLTPHRSAHDALKFVKANNELKTSLGRGRALVRYCLVHGCLADILQQCISDPHTTAYFYLPASPLLSPQHAMSIVTTLYELADVAFDLAPSGYDLDVAWPSFSRSMPGGHSWRPPSRTMSISSLVSHASQFSEAPPSHFPGSPPSSVTMAAPMTPDGPAMDQLRLEVARSETAKATLEIRVTQLEEDNAQLIDKCRELEQQLEQARETAKSEGEEHHEAEKRKLTKEIKDLKQQLAESLPKLVHEMLTEELTLTKNKLSESNSLRKELESTAETLRQELKSLEENEKQLKSNIQTLESKLEDSLSANDRLSASVKDIVRDSEASDSASTLKVFELIEKMTALESERSDAQGTISMYKNRLESLERDYQSLQERCQAAEEEKAVLRNNIRKISEAEEKLRQKMEKLNEREETLEEYEQQVEALKEEIEQMKDKFEERGMLLQAANNIHKQVEAQLQECKHSLKESQEKCQKKTEETEEYKSKARGQEASLMQAEQELEITKARLAEQEATLELVSKHQEAMKDEAEELRLQASELRLQLSTQHIKEEQTLKEQVESAEKLESLLEQMATQEELIQRMEEQLVEVREESASELVELRNSMCQVSQTLSTRDEECASLTQQLSKMKSDFDIEKKEHERIKEEQSRTTEQLKSVTESKKQLEDDMKNLTEKFVQLIKEKDALWQSNTRLLEMGQGHGAGWMEDKNVTKCLGCNSNFSLMLRKHHCRACGRIFCSPCSDNWVHMASSSKRVRVCDGCFTLQTELAGLVTSPLKRLQEEEEDKSNTDEKTANSNSAHASASSRTEPLPISQQPDDDEFSVISDDEIQKSLSASSPQTPSPTDKEQWQKIVCHASPTLTYEQLLQEPINNSEVWVNAGSRLTVPLVLEPGVTLLWKFVSEPKSISFAVMYHPQVSEVDPSAPDVKVLIPTTRVASAQRPVTGKLLAKQPGIYTLIFDNSFSRLIAKKITYSLKGSKESQTVGSPSGQASGNGD